MKGFTNYSCQFYPCHVGVKRDFNCLFCYCPLIDKECPGSYEIVINKYGTKKDCSSCKLNHDGINQSWRFIQFWVSVSPLWDKNPQNQEKIKRFSKLVTGSFDKNDLKWAEENA